MREIGHALSFVLLWYRCGDTPMPFTPTHAVGTFTVDALRSATQTLVQSEIVSSDLCITVPRNRPGAVALFDFTSGSCLVWQDDMVQSQKAT